MAECIECKSQFNVEPDEQRFLRRIDFRFGKEQIVFPPPVQCPACRLMIRTSHRNEQHMYQDVSDLSGKRMISLYAPEPAWGKRYKIYLYDEWHGEGWDPLSYGRDYDFSRSFFEQFAALQKDVPRIGLVAFNNENSPYTTGTSYCKNCHLINSSENSENCFYGKLYQGCRDCVDCSYCYNSELCYECFSVYDCYDCTFLAYGRNCAECYFSENLVGCHQCLFCTNLQRQDYCIFNRPVGKEKFEEERRRILGSFREFEKAKEAWRKLSSESVHKYANVLNCENSTGDFLFNSKNCHDCFDVNDSEDCRHVCVGVNVKDMYDCSNVYLRQELSYQLMGGLGNYRCAFSTYIFHSQEILYSDHIWHSKRLFGCVGLRRASNCIFNKQFTEAEYDALVPKIIAQMKDRGEWARFFPVKWSPFCYNETLAYDYEPLTPDIVAMKGWRWREEKERLSETAGTAVLPDRITDTPDKICEEVLTCAESGRQYKVMPQELAFYRKKALPLPRVAPLVRHQQRELLRNPRKIWPRKCSKCGREMVSSFAPEKKEAVYCESCYAAEL